MDVGLGLVSDLGCSGCGGGDCGGRCGGDALGLTERLARLLNAIRDGLQDVVEGDDGDDGDDTEPGGW